MKFEKSNENKYSLYKNEIIQRKKYGINNQKYKTT